jgi:predicted ATP-grasp superfamily ATP-dependent carboligase
MAINTSTAVMLLGGRENALAVTRNLGRRGIKVYISNVPDSWAMGSRFCAEAFPVPKGLTSVGYWKELLLGKSSGRFHGQVIFACNDFALEFLADSRDDLLAHYLLVDSEPRLQRALLDKRETLALARKANVPTPNSWRIRDARDVEGIRDEIRFPVMVKPIHSHKFSRAFRRKLFVIENSFDEIVEKIRLSHEHGMEVMVVEMIPGPDNLLASYNTFIDSAGNGLFHFTKRTIRRFPVNRGSGCYHISEWLPEVAEQGQKFFKGIGFKGIGNVEFKRDLRDGRLKIIESNARFIAPHELFVRSGVPSDLLVYCHLTKQPLPDLDLNNYIQFKRMWYPVRDFCAYRELNGRGQLSFGGWLRSLLHPQIFPVLSLSDPKPMVTALMTRLRSVAWR